MGQFRTFEKFAKTVDGEFACISSVPNLAAEFGVQELLGTVSSSKLSSHQMPIRGSPRVQKVIASLISSELSSHQMAIRGQPGVQRVTASLIPSKLSSHQMAICSHSGLCRFSALFKPLRRIWADWMHPPRTAFTHYGFRSRQGSSPARHVPLLCLSLFPPPVSLSWYLYV